MDYTLKAIAKMITKRRFIFFILYLPISDT